MTGISCETWLSIVWSWSIMKSYHLKQPQPVPRRGLVSVTLVFLNRLRDEMILTADAGFITVRLSMGISINRSPQWRTFQPFLPWLTGISWLSHTNHCIGIGYYTTISLVTTIPLNHYIGCIIPLYHHTGILGWPILDTSWPIMGIQ